MTRVGGVGERAGGLRRFATRVEAGGAGCGYVVNRSATARLDIIKTVPVPWCVVVRGASRPVAQLQAALHWC